jgi:hypothetical protein
MLETVTASGSVPLAELVEGAGRVVLAGHPRPMAQAVPGTSTVWRPKELLLELARAELAEAGIPTVTTNPHFLKTTEWSAELAVLHCSALELTCPVPIARNVQIIDGEDLLGLAEERRQGEHEGIRRQRAILMQRLASVALAPAANTLLPAARHRPLRLASLLRQVGNLPTDGARPVQWMGCDLETGPYNFLRLKQQPKFATSHVRVLVDAVARGGRPAMVAFATPSAMGEICAALRAFAAMVPAAPEAVLLVFCFGTPEDILGALNERPQLAFFGDNFRCSNIRFLFAPFAAADLMHAVRSATACIDTAHGGLLDALAAAMGVGNRLIVAGDGSFDAWRGGVPQQAGIGWAGLLEPAALNGRHHKTGRAAERELVGAFGAML